MENAEIVTLSFLRKDGHPERTRLEHHTLVEARELAERVLHLGNGLYTEVEICTDNGHVETIQNDDPVGALTARVLTLRLQ